MRIKAEYKKPGKESISDQEWTAKYKERESVCVCVCERERESERERERERERKREKERKEPCEGFEWLPSFGYCPKVLRGPKICKKHASS